MKRLDFEVPDAYRAQLYYDLLKHEMTELCSKITTLSSKGTIKILCPEALCAKLAKQLALEADRIVAECPCCDFRDVVIASKEWNEVPMHRRVVKIVFWLPDQAL